MPIAHKLRKYQDGQVWVDFCSVCGAEGLELNLDCPGKYVVDKKPPEPSIKKFVSGLPDKS